LGKKNQPQPEGEKIPDRKKAALEKRKKKDNNTTGRRKKRFLRVSEA